MKIVRHQIRFPFPFDTFCDEPDPKKFLQASPDRGLRVCLEAIDEAFRIQCELQRSGYLDGPLSHLFAAGTTEQEKDRREGRLIPGFPDMGTLAWRELRKRSIRDRDLSDELLLDILNRYCIEPNPESYLPHLWHEVARLFADATGFVPTYIKRTWNNQPGSEASKGVLEIVEKYWRDLPRDEFGSLIGIVTYTCASDGVDFLEKVYYSDDRPDMDEPNPDGETVRYRVWAARSGLSEDRWVNTPNPLPEPKRFPPVED